MGDAKFNEAITTYYKLKQQYDDKTEKIVSKLRSNTNLTTKEKKEKFRQLNSDNKCVNCGKPGGTIFKQEKNLLSAKCGNTGKPCKLDIQIQKAKYASMNEIVSELNKKINTNKTQTISSKLEFLFGYNSESNTLDTFNKLKMELIEEVKSYKAINEQYLNIVSNMLTNNELTANNTTLITSIQKLKNLIKNYEESDDIGFLKEATDLYINTIDETVKNIQKLKYANTSLDYNEKDKTFSLIQNPYTLAQLQIPVDKMANRVISFKK